MIKDNLLKIREEISRTAERSGRSPDEIDLLAVSKRIVVPKIEEAFQAGQLLFGENFVQEADEKIEKLDKAITWHFIGHLQSNKAKIAARLFHMIETVDRIKIARALNKHAGEMRKKLEILVQVNVGKEEQKSGISPENAGQFLKDLQNFEYLSVRGLMTMPPFAADPELSRPFFRSLKQLAERFTQAGYFANPDNIVLSMGMSNDFTVAIEEGSTLVRVGTAIFGSRT